MRRWDFIKLLGLIGCSEDMLLAQHGILGRAAGTAPILFLNAGQSNDEKGQLLANVDLTAPYQVPFPQIKYWEDAGTWLTLDYTDQDSFQSPLLVGTQAYANQFYLYPPLAAALGCNANTPLFVCSYSIGDTNLADDWKSAGPTGALYTAMINRIVAAIANLTNTYGVAPIIPFFLWDQGEKDGRDVNDANDYAANMAAFVTAVRGAIGHPNLKFIFPLIKMGAIVAAVNPVDFGATVNDAKWDLAVANPTTMITQDSNYFEPSTDAIHFTVLGQTDKNTGTGLLYGTLQTLINAGWLSGSVSPTPPSGHTKFNGYNSYVRFGDILDATFAAANATFRLKLTIYNPPRYGTRTLISKLTTTGDQRTFHWTITGTTLLTFNYYLTVGTGSRARGVSWTQPNFQDGNEHTLEIRYDGSIGTNNGLDRVDLYIDGSLYTTGKALTTNVGTISNTIFNGTAQLAVGAIVNNGGGNSSNNFIMGGWAKNFEVESGAGTDLLNCPDLSTGTDTSGGGNNGTPVNF